MKTNQVNLTADHRQILNQRYGLSDSTIDAWGCFSITAGNIHLLKDFGNGVEPPGIALPLWPPGAKEAAGFVYRPDKPRVLKNNNGKTRICKYEHPRGALNRLHVPKTAQERLFKPTSGAEKLCVVLTEGPIKAEKAVQEGIPVCIALGGVWNWRQRFGDESVPIEDLSKLPMKDIDIEICFDSDAATNPQVRRAERALAAWFAQRGAPK